MRTPTLILLLILLPSVFALSITPTTTSSQPNTAVSFDVNITGNESSVTPVSLGPFIAANGENFTVTPLINLPAPNGGTTQGSISFSIGNLDEPQYNSTLNVTADGVSHLFTFTLNIISDKEFSLQAQEGEAAIHATTGAVVSHDKVELTVLNTGSQPLLQVSIDQVTLSNGQELLNITPSQNNFALNAGANKTVAFDATLAGISKGIYSGVAKVTADGIEKQATLRLTVRDATISIKAENPVFEESERDVNVTHHLLITNNGDFDLTGVSMNFPSGVELVSATPTAILKGETVNVTLKAYIPLEQDSGENALGDVQVISNEGTRTFTISSNAVSKLTINNAKFKLANFVASTVSEDDGTFSRDAYPGDPFSLTVEVENEFTDSDDEDFDIADVEIDVVFVEAGEDQDDIDGEEVQSIDLGAREKETLEIDMDETRIGWDVDEGTHDIIITATGEDDNGAVHTATMTAKVTVRRDPNEDIRIISYDFSSTSLTCGEELTIEVEGRNIGEGDDDEVRLVVSNLNLNIAEDLKFEMGDFAAEECNAIDDPEEGCREFYFKKTFTLPTNIASKVYPVLLKTYHDHSEESDQETINLNVQCAQVVIDEPEEEEPEETDQEEDDTSNGAWTPAGENSTQNTVDVQTKPAQTKYSFDVLPPSAPTRIVNQASLESDPLYVPILAILILIVVGGIITATTALRK